MASADDKPPPEAGAADEFSADLTQPGGSAATEEPGDRLPPVDFSTFVLSLGSSTLMHLGEIEQPGAASPSQSLPLAKHSIDILSMLQEKTRNNLTTHEAQLLENLLYDLRLRYVTASRSTTK
jgi:hypothetical protein